MGITDSTRRESYDKTLENLGPKQKLVFDKIRESRNGLTGWELSQALDWMVHATRPRLTELRDRGLIATFTKRYHAETDRNEAVWVTIEPQAPDIYQDRQRLMFFEQA